MRRIHAVVLGVAITGGVTLPGAARADLLDQSVVVNNYQGDLTIYSDRSYAQTFTVGLAGELSRVGFQVYRTTGATGDLTLQILSTDGGTPSPNSTPPLFETIVPIGDLPTIDDPNSAVPITLVDVSSANIAVTPGQVLAIALRSPNGSGSPPWTLWRMTADSYAGGSSFTQTINSTTWGPSTILGPGQDGGFQAYVNAVPEPSSLALVLIGGLGWAGRRPLGRLVRRRVAVR